jgi:transposase
MRELVDVHYPRATCIRLVQDNLSIHKPGALYEAFAPAEARRILRRLEFHFTPKHASWLNMVECEISVLQRQCLGRRIEDPKRLRIEIAAWQRRRNKLRARIKWMFTTDKALAKLGRAYPVPPKSQNHCDEPLASEAGHWHHRNGYGRPDVPPRQFRRQPRLPRCRDRGSQA